MNTEHGQVGEQSGRTTSRHKQWKNTTFDRSTSISRQSRLAPTFSSRKLQYSQHSDLSLNKPNKRPNNSLLQQNKLLKLQIKELETEIKILKKSQRPTPAPQSDTQTAYSLKNNQEQSTRLKKLLELSCYSIQKIEEEKQLILEDNYTIVELNKCLKEQIGYLSKQNQFMRMERKEIEGRNEKQVKMLWGKVNELQRKLWDTIDVMEQYRRNDFTMRFPNSEEQLLVNQNKQHDSRRTRGDHRP